MDYIDKYSFERYIDRAFNIDSAERNQMCHKIEEVIKTATPDVAAAHILGLFSSFLNERRNDVEYKAAEKYDGNDTAVFRRIG